MCPQDTYGMANRVILKIVPAIHLPCIPFHSWIMRKSRFSDSNWGAGGGTYFPEVPKNVLVRQSGCKRVDRGTINNC